MTGWVFCFNTECFRSNAERNRKTIKPIQSGNPDLGIDFILYINWLNMNGIITVAISMLYKAKARQGAELKWNDAWSWKEKRLERGFSVESWKLSSWALIQHTASPPTSNPKLTSAIRTFLTWSFTWEPWQEPQTCGTNHHPWPWAHIHVPKKKKTPFLHSHSSEYLWACAAPALFSLRQISLKVPNPNLGHVRKSSWSRSVLRCIRNSRVLRSDWL